MTWAGMVPFLPALENPTDVTASDSTTRPSHAEPPGSVALQPLVHRENREEGGKKKKNKEGMKQSKKDKKKKHKNSMLGRDALANSSAKAIAMPRSRGENNSKEKNESKKDKEKKDKEKKDKEKKDKEKKDKGIILEGVSLKGGDAPVG
ncbi:hypothetical protein PG991_014394 [Apiospora marii]|uniref:Uncharacterized protein n=1 Tax=Apiospora marii TaxID=335849 RepID=A0ABR1R8R6_9PEZI